MAWAQAPSPLAPKAAGSAPTAVPLVLVGGTVVDVSDWGRSAKDLPDAVVVMQEGRVAEVGSRQAVAIPKGARVIDCTGKYLVPGLVDGFAGMNSQGQASAYLYMGVTTVVAESDPHHGAIDFAASPAPHLYLLDSIGVKDNWSLLAKRPEWALKLREEARPAELSPGNTDLQLSDTARLGTRAVRLGRNVTAVLRTPGRTRQSVADSSFDAWIKYYRPDENSPNAVVSYYVKGALVGLALDLTLRRDSGITLDDVMRELWRRYGALGIGVPEGGVEEIASELSGRDLAPFFARYVHGTMELPLAELLAVVGIKFNLRRTTGERDKGGAAAKDTPPDVWLGARLAPGANLRVTHLLSGGPAESAGLAAGDVIVAIDGLRASAEAIERLLHTRNAGDVIGVHAFRRDELLSFAIELAAAPVDTCWLALADNAAAQAQRAAWLAPKNRRVARLAGAATTSSAAARSSRKTAVPRRGPSRRAKAR